MKPTTRFQLSLRTGITSALILLLTLPAGSYGQAPASGHVVSAKIMQKRMADSALKRQKNIETLTKFFSTPVAERAIRDAQYNPDQVRRAIPTLTDAELADLAARSTEAQQQFAAGHLTPTELALVVVALVVVVVVIIVH